MVPWHSSTLLTGSPWVNWVPRHKIVFLSSFSLPRFHPLSVPHPTGPRGGKHSPLLIASENYTLPCGLPTPCPTSLLTIGLLNPPQILLIRGCLLFPAGATKFGLCTLIAN